MSNGPQSGGDSMSDASQGEGWWQASDGKWYPPETHPNFAAATPPMGTATHVTAAKPNLWRRFRGQAVWKQVVAWVVAAIVIIFVIAGVAGAGTTTTRRTSPPSTRRHRQPPPRPPRPRCITPPRSRPRLRRRERCHRPPWHLQFRRRLRPRRLQVRRLRLRPLRLSLPHRLRPRLPDREAATHSQTGVTVTSQASSAATPTTAPAASPGTGSRSPVGTMTAGGGSRPSRNVLGEMRFREAVVGLSKEIPGREGSSREGAGRRRASRRHH